MCRRIFKEQTSETGDIPFYKIGTFGAEPDAFISRELFEEYKSKYPYPKKGDILISASGSIGRTVEFAGNNEYFQDSNIVWLSHDERLSNSFLKCFYSVVKWAGIEGSTIKRLYNDNILNTVICMPSVPEQEHIGLFFENLDNLITLHQRQPFLHSTPEISLTVQLIHPFYTSSWEQRKVGDLLIERNQQAPMSDEYPLMAFIANEGVAPKGERYDRSALVTDTVNKLYKKTEKGDFIYSSNNLETGSIGLNKYGKACISPVYSIFEPTGIADSDFLGRRLVRKDFINAMVKWRQGVIYGQWRIHESDFLKIEIPVPSVEEQRKIGAYLDQLDNLITLHQRKFEKLTNVKKSMLEKMFPQNGSSYPEIRFKGFTDPWEQRKLSELTSMHARIGWQNLRTSEFLDSGDYMLITGTDFNDGAINFSTCHYVERERYEQDRNIQIHNGSILITKDGTLGKVAYVQGLSMPATLNAGVFNVQIKDANNVDEKYLFQYLKAPFLMDYVDKKATGGTIKHLNQSILVDFPVILPQRSEQTLIGAFFQQLDNLITLHQRKCISFTGRAGRLISTVNKKRITSSWEQRKLGDMMNVTSVKRIHQSDWTDSGVRFLRARDIVAAAKNEEPDDYLYISKEKYEEYSTLSGKVGVSDLLVTGVGTIGVPYLVRNLEPLYFKDGNIIWFQNSDKIDGKFLFYSFSAEQIQGFINESAGIGTVGTYTIESGKKTPISLPNQIEQAKVGEFFQQLDNLITLHQRQTIVYAVIRSIRKVILAERQYFAPPMVRKSP